MHFLIVAILFAGAVTPAIGSESPPSVVAVYPSAECVPANLLRFYVSFSEPMERGDIREAIALLGSDGQEIVSPFLNLQTELWTPDQTTVTVLLDPGRIKRGVGSNLVGGAPLTPGHRYTLTVSAPLKAASTRYPVGTASFEFCVSEAERRPLTHASWSVSGVRAHSHDPLTVKFDRLMDYGGASGRLAVVTAAGEPVAGGFKLGTDNRSIEFRPVDPWGEAGHRVVAHHSFEDAAGNRFGAAFDSTAGTSSSQHQKAVLSFEPKVVR